MGGWLAGWVAGWVGGWVVFAETKDQQGLISSTSTMTEAIQSDIAINRMPNQYSYIQGMAYPQRIQERHLHFHKKCSLKKVLLSVLTFGNMNATSLPLSLLERTIIYQINCSNTKHMGKSSLLIL